MREPAKVQLLWEFSGVGEASVRIKETNQEGLNEIFFPNNVVEKFAQFV